ncbi:hypothetical protein Pyn_40713 [Prunus yedoensis var. nudiflora]|uniref:Uncharacterized protein n=1 Tax=Prunus yedoensis var. nudiflora TaxID=2094558 RepID=A0A314ZD44_PRUYE|nr:hypothetical protein Pyn_40713 [Prunus yedoensis var. nudiflora]
MARLGRAAHEAQHKCAQGLEAQMRAGHSKGGWTWLGVQSGKGMAGGSDSLKERVTRIENFFGTMSRNEIECMVTQMEDLNAKMAKIERVFEELKASMEKKVIDVLGDMYGLAEAIGGKLKEVEIELGVVKLALIIPPEDPLGDDAIEQPVLKVIEVFVDVFAIEPSEVFIDATLLHMGMLIEAIENIEPNWDLNCGLEEMQFAVLAHCLDTWKIYLLDRKHIDFEERFDELMANATQYVSSTSYPSKSESEDEPWASSAIDNIIRDAMFEKGGENHEAKEDPLRKNEPTVESLWWRLWPV